ncbi:hypothetical protein D3C86_2127320 [compost metagenome]
MGNTPCIVTLPNPESGISTIASRALKCGSVVTVRASLTGPAGMPCSSISVSSSDNVFVAVQAAMISSSSC